MQPRMSRENIVAFVMPAALYPICATARRKITIPNDNVLSMTHQGISMEIASRGFAAVEYTKFKFIRFN